jgi:hypothetical protein
MTGILVAGIVLDPDPFAASAAHSSGILHALGAHQRVVKAAQLLHRVQRMTHTALLQLSFNLAHMFTSIKQNQPGAHWLRAFYIDDIQLKICGITDLM